jgi:hypothetical protein
MKNNLLDRILKNSPTKHASILSESEFFKDKDVIPTDLPILNIAFSGSLDGGLCSGLTVLAGQSKSFKTLLALFCVKAYLDKYPDAVGVLYDSEGGITPEYLDSNGIDPTRVIHIPIEHLEMLKYDMVKTLKEIDRKDKVIMMIDSIGNTASLKELEDAENEKSVAEMQRAKNMKALFRMITPSLIAKDVPCIAIAHTYQTMELYSKAVISGGCLVKGTRVMMSDGTFENIEDILPGDLVVTHSGNHKVTHTWNPNTLADGTPDCIKVTFDDGSNLTTSDNHRFLSSSGDWVYVNELKPGDRLYKFGDSDKIYTSVTELENVGKLPVYDISVEGVNAYVTENGIVSHNTGIMYAANQAFIITKAQEKDADGLAGWKFTINIEKSRFVKEKSKLPFTVLYNKGVQKWSSLFDLALESGHLIKPKMGWYQMVDMETGEIFEKNYRAKDIEANDEFFEKLIQDATFKKFVEHKFKLSGGVMAADEDVDILED